MEGIENCSDCGAKLINELPEESSGQREERDDSLEEFLITAADEIQADILESKLKFYGIPVRRKYRESGDYLKVYMGATPFGIDLFVPGELLEQASELISKEPDTDTSVIDTGPEAVEDSGQEEQNKYDSIRRKRSRFLLLLIFIIPLLLVLIINLINNFNK
jgi:hypothetical protein